MRSTPTATPTERLYGSTPTVLEMVTENTVKAVLFSTTGLFKIAGLIAGVDGQTLSVRELEVALSACGQSRPKTGPPPGYPKLFVVNACHLDEGAEILGNRL